MDRRSRRASLGGIDLGALRNAGVPRFRTAYPSPLPSARRVLPVTARLGAAVGGWWLIDRRKGPRPLARGLSRQAPHRHSRISVRPSSSSARSSRPARGYSHPSSSPSSSSAATRSLPEPFTAVRRIVEEDLGRPLAEIFTAFDPVPLAAASIAQVHAATLRTGEQVVVKVQRPTVATLVRKDLAAMSWLAPLLVGRIP